MNFQKLRGYVTEYLKTNEIENPDIDAAILLMDYFDFSKTDFLIKDFKVSDTDLAKIKELSERRTNGEPVQYITGKCEFMSLEFKVNSKTLIPRADTEVLAESIIEHFKNTNGRINILDIGTGSGCIPISLAHYLENAVLFSIDISQGAIDVAKENAKKIGVSDKISFLKHDIMKCFPDIDCEFDCIVSNPPYIEKSVIPTLQREVKDFEPLSALDGGSDGLDFYRQIVKVGKIKKGGILAFEIGYNQGESVSRIMIDSGKYDNIRIIKDLNKLDRVVVAVAL